jgi:uncharacterized protein with ParB-like and HNH nuclease domain
MGAIVSLPTRTVPVGVNKSFIIDGQQRLTTLSLILCVLRNHVDEKTKRRIQEQHLVNPHFEDLDHLKLLPTQGDREAYRNLVLHEVLPPKEHQVRKAVDFFEAVLADGDHDGHDVNAFKLLSVIEGCLMVVVINLDDKKDDPNLIFESLNYKNERLEQADLVKNYVLMRFKGSTNPGSEQEQVYLQLWRPLEQELGQNLTEFLRHYARKEGEEVRKNGIYAAMKSRLQKCSTAPEVKTELITLSRFAKYYLKFTMPERESNLDIRASLQNLRELKVTTCFPLLLQLFDARDRAVVDDDAVAECIEIIESFVIRRSACGVPNNALDQRFLQLAQDLKTRITGDVFSGCADWLREALDKGTGRMRWPSDTEFKNASITQDQYSKDSAAFLLEKLERSSDHKEPADLANCTIEHVMPQELTPEWKDMLGPQFEDIHSKLLHTIGNLTLSGYNGNMSNSSFDKKLKYFSESHVALNRWIAECPTWGAEQIRQRGELLAERCVELWPHLVPVTS